MRLAPSAKDPADLSYFALRKAVGVIALVLPFAVAIPWWFLDHRLETSISYYYYTVMRNLFWPFCPRRRFLSNNAGQQRNTVAEACWNRALHFCRASLFDARRLLSGALQDERQRPRRDAKKGAAQSCLHGLRNRDHPFHPRNPSPPLRYPS